MLFARPLWVPSCSHRAGRGPAAALFLLLILCAQVSCSAPATSSSTQAVIRFRSGPVVTELLSGQALQSAAQGITAKVEARHVVVQFSTPVTTEERRALIDSGLRLLSYLGDAAHFAAVEPGGLDLTQLTANAGPLALLSIEPP